MILDQATAHAPLNEEITSSIPASCSDECIPLLFDSMREHPEAWEDLYGSGTNRAPDGCNYVPYVASLVVCTAAGPVLYWPCAILAYCTWCFGPTHDAICGPLPSPL